MPVHECQIRQLITETTVNAFFDDVRLNMAEGGFLSAAYRNSLSLVCISGTRQKDGGLTCHNFEPISDW
jgi:hypothetical protein